MYSACLFCARPFGRNESIEPFPVGQRLAFDAAKGRLWVVCAACTRWCLVPIEERWEAIEACEKAFRDTRLRVSTDQIGLAKLRDGTELVRVGAPLRPEMAAWRYGRAFTARHRRTVALGATAATVGVAGVAAGAAAGAGGALLTVLAAAPTAVHLSIALAWGGWRLLDNARAVAVPHEGKLLQVNREELKQTVLVPTDDAQAWGLELKHSWGRLTLTGDDAVRATTRLLARANGRGAGRQRVTDAVEQLGRGETVTDALRTIAARSADRSAAHRERVREAMARWEAAGRDLSSVRGQWGDDKLVGRAHVNPASLALMPAVDRLAFEMALHEERERCALEGELAPLAAAWAEAEQVAAIADGLLVPPEVSTRLETLRTREHDPR